MILAPLAGAHDDHPEVSSFVLGAIEDVAASVP